MSTRAISRLLISAAVIAPDTNLQCCKRSELPLYIQEQKQEEAQPKFHNEKSNVIEETIRTIRVNIDSVLHEVRKYEDMGKNYVKEGVDNAQWLVDYLGDEDNQAPKAPAIAIGGLTGFIFGLRGGFFKKVIYTGVGAMGMAAVCYPKEAKEYGALAADEGHKYATIAYNFIYGVKKGDKPLELPTLPKLPGSISEVVTIISDFASSTTASLTDKSVMPPVEDKKVSDKDKSHCKWDHEKELRERKLKAAQENIEYYEGNKCCPCHLGSCMHTNSKEDCPEDIPYPTPTGPTDPPIPPDPECKSR